MANHSERPSYIFRSASEYSPDAEVMAKNDVERYVHWLNEEHKADIEELNEEHGADIEQTWSRAREYYVKNRELGGNA